MNTLNDIFSEYPYKHHAYGIESYTASTADILSFIDRDHYSYIFEKEYEQFKIDDARSIKALAGEKTEKGALFLIHFSVITLEAQNALLKVLEEPKVDTYFILIFPNRNILVDTLRSRIECIALHQEMGNYTEFVSADEYMKMSLFDRFEYNKQYTDKKKEEALSKQDVLNFLNQAEVYFMNNKKAHTEEIFSLKQYLNAKGASTKMILDHLAILFDLK